jgi:hypothetical protein
MASTLCYLQLFYYFMLQVPILCEPAHTNADLCTDVLLTIVWQDTLYIRKANVEHRGALEQQLRFQHNYDHYFVYYSNYFECLSRNQMDKNATYAAAQLNAQRFHVQTPS